jgi:hypothetical protein
VHAVVGDFATRDAVVDALSALAARGIAPADVSVVAGDPDLARDVGGRSYALAGFIGGALLGLALSIWFVLSGGERMLTDPFGIVIGAFGTIGGLAFIGVVVGRAIVRRSPDAQRFADEVRRGDTLVAVACDGETCDRVREALRGAGAAEIRDEESPGPF